MVNLGELFISKSKLIHENKYLYDLVEYKNANAKVKIICQLHGIFEQKPSKHLLKQGCPKCSKYRKKTIHEFIVKANEIHNNKYDYEKSDFSHIKNKIIISCPEHGEFLQTLDKHLNFKRGCPKCGGSLKKTLDEFINEAMNVHGELYDYSKSIYSNFETKLIIICRIHGEFLQTPHNHIIGKQGCPICVHRISKGEVEWLDYLGVPNDPNCRNVYIKLDDRTIKADGYDSQKNIIYEFYGDYYHGNPLFYNGDVINQHTKSTFGKLYENTLKKEESILRSGFQLINIWEHQWKDLRRNMKFKDQYKEIQILAFETTLLKNYNDDENEKIKNGANPVFLLFSEAAVLCLTLERFLKIIPAIKAKEKETLRNFLDRALSKKKPLFKIPQFNDKNGNNGNNIVVDSQRIIEVATQIRNGILHGDFEQLAKEYSNCNNIYDYFKGGHFTQDMAILYTLLNSFMKQVDSSTGNIIP